MRASVQFKKYLGNYFLPFEKKWANVSVYIAITGFGLVISSAL